MSGLVLPKCVLTAVSFAGIALTSPLAYSLGLGGVNTKSYIGQPLLVQIPLYNVESPETLQLDLERIDDSQHSGLSAELSRSNSQLSILIRSQAVVNEPYFNFALNLVDNGNEFRKQFTVLLDLSPSDARRLNYQPSQRQNQRPNTNTRVSPSVIETQALNSQRLSSQALNSQPIRTQPLGIQSPNSVMGPYDWAKSGAIPAKFGAVLDGQSLWRVARRISPAMNVTNNQMMWALYQRNRQAFSTDRIDSLRAGVYLEIPSAAEVAAVSDVQADRMLKELSGPARQNIEATKAVSLIDSASTAEGGVDENDTDVSELTDSPDESINNSESADLSSDQFQLSGLDQKVSNDGALVGPKDDQSKEIISSLAETISSMTEQLGRKDKRIDALEDQVAELKSFIQEGEIESTMVLEDQTVVEPVSSQELVAQEEAQSIPKYIWLLLVIGVFSILGLLMRKRFARLWSSLNFGAESKAVDFQVSQMDVPHHVEFNTQTQPQSPVQSQTVQPQAAQVQNATLDQSAAQQPNPLDDVLVDQVEDQIVQADEASFSFSESEFTATEFSDDEFSALLLDEDYEAQDEAINFAQRFSQLIAEGNTELARQLLDISHGNQIESDRYHYHRLQLLALEKEDDGFYDYYSDIDKDIPSFAPEVQTDISKLVVRMAQRDYDVG